MYKRWTTIEKGFLQLFPDKNDLIYCFFVIIFLSDPCAHGVRSLGSKLCPSVTELCDLVKALVKDPS